MLPGSLPPSPADSGVSDVDSSSSGGQPCSEELKARLGLPIHCPPQGHVPTGTFLNPNFYHNSPPLRNIWNNRNVPCKCAGIFFILLFFFFLETHALSVADKYRIFSSAISAEFRKYFLSLTRARVRFGANLRPAPHRPVRLNSMKKKI